MMIPRSERGSKAVGSVLSFIGSECLINTIVFILNNMNG